MGSPVLHEGASGKRGINEDNHREHNGRIPLSKNLVSQEKHDISQPESQRHHDTQLGDLHPSAQTQSLRNIRLDHDLETYSARAWHLNRPGKNYTVQPEDLVPALAGVIGKIALVAAFAVAWKNSLGIDSPDFITENVRLELFIASMLALLFSAVLHPRLGPPGTLAPLIPLVPAMAAAGVHPLAFGLLLGAAGIALAVSGSFSRIMTLTGPGTKSGILLLFGLMGVVSSLRSLWTWSQAQSASLATISVLSLGIVLVVVLHQFKIRWLVIPGLAALALLLAWQFGISPLLKTAPGLPILNPELWWLEKMGTGLA